MNNFSTFFKSLLEEAKLSLSGDLSIDQIRLLISKINEYFYTNYEGIGYTEILGDSYEYFSEFHKFWEKHHKDILNPTIDIKQSERVADVLHDVYIRFNGKPFSELYDTFGLDSKDVCRIRYFSANQDFRGSREFKTMYDKFQIDPSIFDTKNIYDNPEDFLKNLGITDLSQNDKRVKYAKVAASLLIDNNIDPFDLIKHCNNDLIKVRDLMISNKGAGYGKKKADMFLRDMVVLGVWNKVKNFDRIDVASDINTIKVSLRTGILQVKIPLLSSFMDIFSYQYSIIDEVSSNAWRKVWEIWKRKYPDECIESPCLIDYLVYRIIGKEFCKEILCLFKCESGKHTFKWHSSLNKTCQICNKKKIKNKAKVIKKMLPCSDAEGHLVIEKNKFVMSATSVLPGLEECPFGIICESKSEKFKKLNPPKSISILGQTGWESAKTRYNQGGGGLMA